MLDILDNSNVDGSSGARAVDFGVCHGHGMKSAMRQPESGIGLTRVCLCSVSSRLLHRLDRENNDAEGKSRLRGDDRRGG